MKKYADAHRKDFNSNRVTRFMLNGNLTNKNHWLPDNHRNFESVFCPFEITQEIGSVAYKITRKVKNP